MSEIKNGGLDQYGKVWSLNWIGSERVKVGGVVYNTILVPYVCHITESWIGLWRNKTSMLNKTQRLMFLRQKLSLIWFHLQPV